MGVATVLYPLGSPSVLPGTTCDTSVGSLVVARRPSIAIAAAAARRVATAANPHESEEGGQGGVRYEAVRQLAKVQREGNGYGGRGIGTALMLLAWAL